MHETVSRSLRNSLRCDFLDFNINFLSQFHLLDLQS
uniref:Uncharacterized protein n=1 Tax=Rhizophora mucronata TaxID=61149 RepID=A0A2P2JTG6_RHIMU